ncbi:hypothetical protein HN873_047726 [Arachis hypogaea]
MKLEEQEKGERANLKGRRGCGRTGHNRVRRKVEDEDTGAVGKPREETGTCIAEERTTDVHIHPLSHAGDMQQLQQICDPERCGGCS